MEGGGEGGEDAFERTSQETVGNKDKEGHYFGPGNRSQWSARLNKVRV